MPTAESREQQSKYWKISNGKSLTLLTGVVRVYYTGHLAQKEVNKKPFVCGIRNRHWIDSIRMESDFILHNVVFNLYKKRVNLLNLYKGRVLH